MKAVIFGGTGFLGKNLYPKLPKKWDNVAISSTWHDIADEYLVKKFMEQEQPDIVYHLAGIPNSKPSDPDQNRILDVNIKGTHNILRYMRPKTKIVFASSIVVYGNKQVYQNEFDDHRDCTSVYAATKVASEELIKAYSVLNDIDYTILRLSAMVGPYMTHGLVKVILEKLKTENTYIELLGDKPGSIKPYTYVKDVVNKMIELPFLSSSKNNRIVNVCNNDPISVEDVAYTIMEETGIHKEIRWLGDGANWKGDNKELLADNSLCLTLSKTGFLDSRRAIIEALHDYKP